MVRLAALAGTQTSTAVIFATRTDTALGAQHFAVQTVPLEVTDDLPIQVDLMQVPATVAQAVEPAAVGKSGLGQVAHPS